MYWFRERHGVRVFWHLGARSVVAVEFYWWRRSCRVGVVTDDDGWSLSVALPPLALYLSLDGFPLWQPMRVSEYLNPPAALPDQREFNLAIHDWTIWLTPWGRWREWRSNDPWWIRGVSVDLKDAVLGRASYRIDDRDVFEGRIALDGEGAYAVVVSRYRQEWQRPRWPWPVVQEGYRVRSKKGVPVAGKGENSWDCGDDAIYERSFPLHECATLRGEASPIAAALAFMREVRRRRERYGPPSAEAIARAVESDPPGGLRVTHGRRG